MVLKKWVGYGRDLDWSLYLKDRVTKPDSVNTSDVVMLDTDVPVVQQKNYDLMGDLLESDVLMIFKFGYLPRMTLANIDVMNAESFCERILSCASLVVTDLHTSLDHDEVRMLTMLRMNKSLMEYMSKEYDNLHSTRGQRNSNQERVT